MDIAKVIVDVPVRSTDRPFDYIIPDALKLWIEVGSRVAVPFGPRTGPGVRSVPGIGGDRRCLADEADCRSTGSASSTVAGAR